MYLWMYLLTLRCTNDELAFYHIIPTLQVDNICSPAATPPQFAAGQPAPAPLGTVVLPTMASAAAAVLRWGLRLALPDTASDVQLYDGGEEEEASPVFLLSGARRHAQALATGILVGISV